MKIIQIVGILISLLMYANGAKVTWGADGKPIIESSSKPLNGCTQGGLKDLSMDVNSTIKG
jgi:hypothetical protein